MYAITNRAATIYYLKPFYQARWRAEIAPQNHKWHSKIKILFQNKLKIEHYYKKLEWNAKKINITHYGFLLQVLALLGIAILDIYVISKNFEKKYLELTRRAPNVTDQLDSMDPEILKWGVRCLIAASEHKEWWLHEIFCNKDYPFFALYGVKMGILSVDDFANIMCYWAAKQESDRELIHIFLEDPHHHSKANPLLVEIICRQAEESYFFLDQIKVEEALENILKSKNNFHKTLFLLASKQEDFRANAIPNNVTEAIMVNAKYQFLLNLASDYIEKEGCEWGFRMVPNISIHKEMLKIIFKAPSLPNPVIGVSNIRDIQIDGVIHKRDTALPFPGLTYAQADGLNCKTLLCFLHHDLYHSFRASSVGSNTEAIIKVAQIIRQAAKDSPPDLKKTLLHTAWKLEDMEHTAYREKPFDENLGSKFWRTVDRSLSPIITLNDKENEIIYNLNAHIIEEFSKYKWHMKCQITITSLIAISSKENSRNYKIMYQIAMEELKREQYKERIILRH